MTMVPIVASIRPLLTLALLAVLCGCGKTRVEGDPDGIPVTFAVHVDAAFFSRMANHSTTVGTGAGVGFGHGAPGLGLGLGIGFRSTTAYLLGGANPGEAGSFRRRLSWGDNRFTIPLRSGRSVTLTAQAEGGREGWESVGEFTVAGPGADEVDLTLDENGSRITVR